VGQYPASQPPSWVCDGADRGNDGDGVGAKQPPLGFEGRRGSPLLSLLIVAAWAIQGLHMNPQFPWCFLPETAQEIP
jgi:hypothetical protein